MKYDKDKIKDIILTDYLDNQLDEVSRKQIEKHIQSDPELQDFLQTVRKNVQEPFEKMGELQPPERVWQRIQEQIEVETEETFSIAGLWGYRIKRLFATPKPVFAAVCVVLILVATVPYFQLNQSRAYVKEQQIEYLILLAEGEFESVEGPLNTAIEEYFL